MQEEQQPKKKWYKTRKNWGFWVLIIAFILFCITWFIIRPLLERGG